MTDEGTLRLRIVNLAGENGELETRVGILTRQLLGMRDISAEKQDEIVRLRKQVAELTADRDKWKQIVKVYVDRDSGMITGEQAREAFDRIGKVDFR